MEAYLNKIITVLLALVTTWVWHDKRQRDARFRAIEVSVENLKKDTQVKIDNMESAHGGTKLQLKGLEGKMSTIDATGKLQFKILQESAQRVENKLDYIIGPNRGLEHVSDRNRIG